MHNQTLLAEKRQKDTVIAQLSLASITPGDINYEADYVACRKICTSAEQPEGNQEHYGN